MLEQSFAHLPTPEPKKVDLAHKMAGSEKPLTHKDVAAYVDNLAARIKNIGTDESKKIILHELTDRELIKTFLQEQFPVWKQVVGVLHKKTGEKMKQGMRDIASPQNVEVRATINRVRSAVMEELKKRLSLDPDFAGSIRAMSLFSKTLLPNIRM